MARLQDAIKDNDVIFGFASTSNRRDLAASLVRDGYPTGATPNRLDLNQIWCQLYAARYEYNSKGIPEWDVSLNYDQYACVQAGGLIWISTDFYRAGA